jgi:hypothetical protein
MKYPPGKGETPMWGFVGVGGKQWSELRPTHVVPSYKKVSVGRVNVLIQKGEHRTIIEIAQMHIKLRHI